MLEAGVEQCGGDAALYLRVDPACPVYWVRWDARRSKVGLDISYGIPYRGSRTVVLQRVDFTADSKGDVKIRHARNKPSDITTTSTICQGQYFHGSRQKKWTRPPLRRV